MDTVLIRRWNKKGHKVFALFPELAGELEGSVLWYDMDDETGKLVEHEALYTFALARSRPVNAVAQDGKNLCRKLISEGMELDIRARKKGGGRRGRIDPSRDSKLCPSCGETKDRDDFAKSKGAKDRMHSTCLECSTLEQQARALARKTKEEMEALKTSIHRKIEMIDLVETGEYSFREIAKIMQGTMELDDNE